jgi:hypothetical protein
MGLGGGRFFRGVGGGYEALRIIVLMGTFWAIERGWRLLGRARETVRSPGCPWWASNVGIVVW